MVCRVGIALTAHILGEHLGYFLNEILLAHLMKGISIGLVD